MERKNIAVLHEYVNHFKGNISGHDEGGIQYCNYMINPRDQRYVPERDYDGSTYWDGRGIYRWSVYSVSHIDEIIEVGVYQTAYELDEWGNPINKSFHLYRQDTGAVIPCDKHGMPLGQVICHTNQLQNVHFVKYVQLIKYKSSGSMALIIKDKHQRPDGSGWWGIYVDDNEHIWLSGGYDCIFCRKQKIVVFPHRYSTKVRYDPWDKYPMEEIPWYKNL